jgi:hypothetical protein
MKPSTELVDALLGVLGGNEPDLSSHAAWALGKMQDKSAVIGLREVLYSDQPLLRARAARALATLGDTDSIPQLLDNFRKETNPGLKIAYAQGLGKLRSKAAVDEMLSFMESLSDETLRSEMALAMGRIVGNESSYVYLWRQLKHDQSTAIAQVLLNIQKEYSSSSQSKLAGLFETASMHFASSELDAGIAYLGEIITILLQLEPETPVSMVLLECHNCLKKFGLSRSEYVLLALHTVSAAAKSIQTSPAWSAKTNSASAKKSAV